MAEKSYPEKLKDPRWQKLRLSIFSRDKWTCKLCKDDSTTLNVHHLKYSNDPWDAPKCDLVTLCAHCHIEIERAKKHFAEVEFSKISIYKSNNWVDKSRIMYVNLNNGIVVMRIYSGDGSKIIGFNIPSENFECLRKIFK